jgi:uncharacterized protein (TIGR00369 family)
MSHRSLTVSWEDPHAAAANGARLSGLDYMKGMIAGRFPRPPMACLLGFDLVEVGEGFAAFECRPGEQHYNPIGVVHGGLACTLLDSAMGCSVNSTLAAGMAYTTLELKVNLVRPLTMNTGLVRCEGRIVHRGSRTATADGRLIDAAGKLYAHATTTCIIFPAPPAT